MLCDVLRAEAPVTTTESAPGDTGPQTLLPEEEPTMTAAPTTAEVPTAPTAIPSTAPAEGGQHTNAPKG